jgi:hypothetical protein
MAPCGGKRLRVRQVLGGEWSSFKTHSLEVLLILSGQELTIKSSELSTDWSEVKSWDPESRYDPTRTATEQAALRIVSATKNLLRAL